MFIGTNGTLWYCSKGRCMEDPDGKFTSKATLREAVEAYQTEFGGGGLAEISTKLEPFLDLPPSDYLNRDMSND